MEDLKDFQDIDGKLLSSILSSYDFSYNIRCIDQDKLDHIEQMAAAGSISITIVDLNQK